MVNERGEATDLASGSRVVLLASTAGGRSDQARWAYQCDWLFRLRHPACARLVDYGLCGEMKRFEAWRGGSAAIAKARSFLDGMDEAAGAPVSEIGGCGLLTIPRDEARAIGELFEDTAAGPRAIAMWGPAGIGLRAAMCELARAARMHGFVPVMAAMAATASRDGRLADLLHGRSVLLLCPADASTRWTPLLEWSLRSPRAHVSLFVGRREVPGIEGVALKRVPAEALVNAVCPRDIDESLKRRIRRAAYRAQGLPGRFASVLWGTAGQTALATRAAERVAEYAVAPRERVWPASWPGLDTGRWARADRELRQAIGRLARRHDWASATIGATQLAGALVTRGRPRDAQALLSDAREYAGRADDDARKEALQHVALMSGVAWTDLAKLEEAEAVLRTVVASAEGGGGEFGARAGLALARCLFWRGRFDEARQAVERVSASGLSGATGTRASILASRLAVAGRRYGDAVSTSTAVLHSSVDPQVRADVACAAAFAHLAVGDHGAVERDVACAVNAARQAHNPLRALRARLLGAESARRQGRLGPARALLARVQRLSASTLPPIVKARCDLLRDLLSEPDSISAANRRARSTGLPALALFAPVSPAACPERPRREAGHPVLGQPDFVALDDSLEILRCCQSAEEEGAVLAAVCARVKTRLNAAAVAFFGTHGIPVSAAHPLTLLATEGRLEPAVAERVVSVGQAVGPDSREGRVEGGAPVRYGGEVIGALAARWTPGSLGSPPDRARASAVLTMAAVAAGPAVAAIGARPVEVDHGASGELLGMSRAMDEVRRAVERAGTAPFSVLIQGESGSGKELVARALHRRSPRRARPFCTLNCAALPDDLVESELFGHARGAFTGAVSERAGVFEEAHTGTLFLDEVGELSPRAQAKVLRAIQEGEIRRVGENVPRRIDVRIVSATNRDLPEAVSGGRFRLDLLYRLDVIHIALPPLRDRRDDIAVLVERYWREAAGRVGNRSTLSASTIAALARYDWPGNVRELQNVLASLAVRSGRSGVVPPTALPPAFGAREAERSWRLDEARRGFEERFVRAALVRSGGRREQAAIELGLTRQGLRKMMTRLGISE